MTKNIIVAMFDSSSGSRKECDGMGLFDDDDGTLPILGPHINKIRPDCPAPLRFTLGVGAVHCAMYPICS